MATYKVIQDIEAEDKLLGPLSLRQFIYAVIVVILGFVMFKLFMVQPLLAFPFLLPALLFGILAAPFGHDQSSEIWLLAKIRFFLKPRVRIWDQSGLKELVKITVPKKIEQILTDGLDESQVKSRLQALAQTIDTRGWAVKGLDVNLYANPLNNNSAPSDRLIGVNDFTPPKQVSDVTYNDDMLDTQNNPVAQKMGQMVQANDEARRQSIMNNMQQIRDSRTGAVTANPPMPAIPARPANSAYGQTAVLQPLAASPPLNMPATPVTEPVKPAILDLASNDDLSVATIARQANKKNSLGDEEVVISLR